MRGEEQNWRQIQKKKATDLAPGEPFVMEEIGLSNKRVR